MTGDTHPWAASTDVTRSRRDATASSTIAKRVSMSDNVAMLMFPNPQRFWTHVDKDGPIPMHRPDLGPCWIWTGSKVRDGYGEMRVGGAKGKRHLAHRCSWQLHFRSIPVDMFVCHSCDNRPCVRPDHLFLGTTQDNTADRHRKGRDSHHGGIPVRYGEEHHNCKLVTTDVMAIRAAYVPRKVSQRVLAAQFGVSHTQIGHILRGEQRLNG